MVLELVCKHQVEDELLMQEDVKSELDYQFLTTKFRDCTLKSKKQFDQFFKKSKRVNLKAFTYYYNFTRTDSEHVAFVASKKVGNAVVRNYCKRVLRMLYMETKLNLPSNMIIVMIAKSHLPSINYDHIKSEFLNSLSVKGIFNK